MENNNEIKQYIPRGKEYWAKLPEFEGPLDILLHFVKEDEIDIYNIPISKIIKDFMGYIDYMQSLDIEIAGEFLLMATELMKIKARMLMPLSPEEEETVEEDPRMVLVRKLLEYKRFKEASENLSKLEDETRKRFFRSFFDNDCTTYEKEYENTNIKNLTIFNLIKGYRDALINIRKEIVHPIEPLPITPEDQKNYVIKILFENVEISFYQIIQDLNDKLKIVCTFIAILQLALEGFLKIKIEDNDINNFSIYKTNPTTN
ncbi:MAG: segregation/condensation protein A [Ignavibacteria bacterium]|nr:segregation/condensation protein A [Ignavibacteria bacterium]